MDSQIEDENEVVHKDIDFALVLAKMGQSKSDNLIILDACRDIRFNRLFRSTSPGLSSMDVPKGTFISYATALGKTADDSNGKNGLYTAELIKVLETRGIRLEQLFKERAREIEK